MNPNLDHSHIPDSEPVSKLIGLSDQQYPLLIIDSYKNKINAILEEHQDNESQDSEILELLGSTVNDSEDSFSISPETVNALELSLILLDKISNSYK